MSTATAFPIPPRGLTREEYERKCRCIIAQLKLRPGRLAEELQVLIAEGRATTKNMLDYLQSQGEIFSIQSKVGTSNRPDLKDRWFPTGYQQPSPPPVRSLPKVELKTVDDLPPLPVQPDPKQIKPLRYRHSKKFSPELRTKTSCVPPVASNLQRRDRAPARDTPPKPKRYTQRGAEDLPRIEGLILQAIATQPGRTSYALWRSLKPTQTRVTLGKFNRALLALEANGQIYSSFEKNLCVWRTTNDSLSR